MALKGKIFATLICTTSASKHFQVPDGKNSPVGDIMISFPGANFFYYCLIFTCLIPKEKGAEAISIRSKDKATGKDSKL